MNVAYHNDISNTDACVATVGIFDGVHLGHRYLIDQVKECARKQNVQSVIITFANHPRSVINSSFRPELLNTLEEKIALISATGVDRCVVLEFDTNMANLSAQEFLTQILNDKFNVRTLIVGHDHRFGRNRTDAFPDYKKYGAEIGMEVIQAKRFSNSEFEHVSSSEIRSYIHKADISAANKLLDYNFSIDGKVVEGFKLGTKIGFPTANIAPDNVNKIIPPNGVYAVRIRIESKEYVGMMNIGTRPTITNDRIVSLEVNVFDFDRDIYNQNVHVEFIKKIREEKKFENVDELISQLILDKKTVQDLLA